MAEISHTAQGDARRAAILAAARECFIRNGFHATSMQDLLHAAGLSAGAFYRYYPSKDSIIVALAATALAEVSSALDDDTAANPPTLETLMCRVIFAIERLDARQATPRIAVQFWGEAQRNPELAQTASEAMQLVFEWFEGVVAALQKRGELPSRAAARPIAMTLAGLVQGFMVQRTVLGLGAEAYCEGLRGLKLGSGACAADRGGEPSDGG